MAVSYCFIVNDTTKIENGVENRIAGIVLSCAFSKSEFDADVVTVTPGDPTSISVDIARKYAYALLTATSLVEGD